MSKLLLYLKGSLYQTIEIEVPEYSDLPFEDKCKAREEFVNAEAAIFKLTYLNSIIKAQHDYKIEWTVESGFCKKLIEIE